MAGVSSEAEPLINLVICLVTSCAVSATCSGDSIPVICLTSGRVLPALPGLRGYLGIGFRGCLLVWEWGAGWFELTGAVGSIGKTTMLLPVLAVRRCPLDRNFCTR